MWSWEGWTAISALVNVLIVISAFFAIYISIRQNGYTRKSKIGMSLHFGLGLARQDNEFKVIPGSTIEVVNLGLSPIYIKDVGITFMTKKKKRKVGITYGHEKPFLLNVGQSETKSIEHLELLFDSIGAELSIHDQAYIFTQLATGKEFLQKTEFDFAGIKFEWEKVLSNAIKSSANVEANPSSRIDISDN